MPAVPPSDRRAESALQQAIDRHRAGDREAAEALYRDAIALDPRLAAAHNNLGNLLHDQGRLDEAVACYRQALRSRPDYALALNSLGAALRQLGRLAEAENALRRAVAIKPDYAKAWNNLGNLLRDRGEEAAAADAFARAWTIDPDFLEALSQLVRQKQLICDWRGIEAPCGKLLAAVDAGSGRVPPFTFLALPGTRAQQLACARAWTRRRIMTTAANSAPRRHASDRLTIGYLSGDFRQHPIGFLVADLLECHDRRKVLVHGYSYGPDDGSAIRERLSRACDRFADIAALPAPAAAARIRADTVDILVDLAGYTQGARPELLALRPAPIQVAYLGFPATMGADFIDYVVADPLVTPLAHERDFAEKLALLPDTYQANDRQRAIAAATPSRRDCGLPDDGFVFCCFNNAYKLTPAVFAVWMRLLDALPGSVLWLLEANRWAVDNLRREARERGVDPARLVVAPRLPPAEHLARHRRADLFLDTLPYNAHTTASDALWAGLPVLTCQGATFASRVAASLLHAIGLPELVTTSLADYEALALALARDPDRLRQLRDRLAANRDTAPLFDTPRFTRHLEAAYATMWDIHARREATRSFAVPRLDVTAACKPERP